MHDVEVSLADFSKHLLVTIFAVFAFTSGALLDSSSIWVNIIFIAALITAIIGMTFGFRVAIVKVNYFLMIEQENRSGKDQEKKGGKIPKRELMAMKSALQMQYYCSLASLNLLVISIVAYFFTENC